jgi:hypothetical protein
MSNAFFAIPIEVYKSAAKVVQTEDKAKKTFLFLCFVEVQPSFTAAVKVRIAYEIFALFRRISKKRMPAHPLLLLSL